jgi:hypothetical protein
MISKIFDNVEKGKRVWEKETICELHREIYDLLVIGLCATNPILLRRIIPILERAYICGIKMNRKMVDKKCQMQGWEKHIDKKEVIRIRLLRKKLVAELERIKKIRDGS